VCRTVCAGFFVPSPFVNHKSYSDFQN